jgi:hypothetical protein
MKKQTRDLFGLESTSLQPVDDAPEFDGKGLTGLLIPKGSTVADDTEEDAAFTALLDELSPGEAQEVVDTMRPLNEDELDILESTPGLKGLTKVDDPEHEDWMIENSRRGYQGLDPVLDDSIYGDTHMNRNEEQMERLGLDSDLGWGIPGLSSLKKAASSAFSLAKKGVTMPASMAWRGAKAIGSTAMRFVPGRDAGKAQVVRSTYAKLWPTRANYLGLQDQRSGRPLRPRAYYESVAKNWAKGQMKRGGLPVTAIVGKDEILGAEIMGGEIMGSWWNPLSWFQSQATVVVNNTAGQRSDVGPNGQPMQIGPDGQPIGPNGMPLNQYPEGSDPYAAQADPYAQQADPYAQQAAYDPNAYAQDAYDPYASQGDVETGISGDDTLGAFATEILSGVDVKKQQSKADQLVALGVNKLRNGKPLSPGEVGVLATLARQGHPRSKRVMDVLLKQGAVVSGEADDSGAFLYKLNPAYWFKSKEERKFTDIEKNKWIENAALQKKLGKKKALLDQAEKAKAASDAVEAAKSQAAATEEQLKAISDSIKGEFVGEAFVGEEFVGHDKPTPVTTVVMKALEKTGKKNEAMALYAKIAKGEPLTEIELKNARKIARLLHSIRVVHGDLIEASNDPALVMHGAFVGACIMGNIENAANANRKHKKIAEALGKKIAEGKELASDEVKLVRNLLKGQKKLHDFTKSHVSGSAFVGHSKAKTLCRGAFVGATKVMSDADKKMVSTIVKLAASGNPRAVKALAELKKSGDIMGGDFIGFSLSSAFKYATAPIWLPAKHIASAAKWTGQKLGIVSKGGSSPEQVRLSQLTAARKRATAARARAAAADAKTQAELRAQNAIAAAADAEADAADAEALAKEAAMKTKEVEANPDLASEDTSGAFVGAWTKQLKPDSKSAKIVAKAAEQSPTGTQIRAGAEIYRRAKRGDKKAYAAVATMVAKAKKGDKQALHDVNVIKAGRLAVLAKQKALKTDAVAKAKTAKVKKVIAVQRKLEAGVANKLVRMTRKRQLNTLAKVERKAATGNKSARAFVKKQVVLAQKGDKRAAGSVKAMKLAKTVRLAAKTPRERKNLVAAQKFAEKVRKGNPKAVRVYEVNKAAASAGNPNAKRFMGRVAIGVAVASTIATGVAVLPKVLGKKVAKKAPVNHKQNVAVAKAKQAAGTATREELAAGARSAQALGNKQEAGNLAVSATKAPSATEDLKRTAPVVAAKEAGNEQAKEAIVKNFEAAKTGDPNAIKKTANVVAVQLIDDINKGKPISQTMQDAANLNERIAARDPSAIAEAKEITKAATQENPIPEATLAAVSLTAAATVAKALAAKPNAKAEYLAKVNPPLPPAEQTAAQAELTTLITKANQGTITPEEGVKGVRLAERLNQHSKAAIIAAKAPPYEGPEPLSSLPDLPLAPITGLGSLITESLKALAFATRDPLANYRGGITGRSRSVATSTTMGWSPFSIFRKLANVAPILLPATAALSSTAALAMAIDSKTKKKKPAPAPAPIPAPVPTPPTVPVVAPAAETSKTKDDQLGAERGFKEIIVDALQSKKLSKKDFNKAVLANVGLNASATAKTASGDKILTYLTSKGVKVET